MKPLNEETQHMENLQLDLDKSGNLKGKFEWESSYVRAFTHNPHTEAVVVSEACGRHGTPICLGPGISQTGQ